MKPAPALKEKRVKAHFEDSRAMVALTDGILKHRRLIVALIISVTLASLIPLRHLQFRNTVTEWLPRDDDVMSLFLDTGHTFGMNELVLVTLKAASGETFSYEILEALRNAQEELALKPEVFFATSIVNAPDISRDEDGLRVSDFLRDIPRDDAVLEAVKKEAISRENFADTFISRDGEWLSLTVFLRNGQDSNRTFAGIIRPVLEKHLGGLAELHYSGEPATSYYMEAFIKSDILRLVPMVVLIVLLTLFVGFGSLRGVLFPSITVWFSTVWVFGLMGLLGIPLKIITPALPVLLIALGSAYGIHIVNVLSLSSGGAGHTAVGVAASLRRVIVPVMMASLTTMIGFTSFLTARLKLVMEFGALAALGILFAAIVAVLFIPAATGLLPPPRSRTGTKSRTMSFRFLEPVASFVIRRRRVILLAAGVVFVAFLLGIPRISREVDFSRYFPADSTPRRATAVVEEHFDGAFPLTVYFQAENVRSADTLRRVRRAVHFLAGLDHTGMPLGIPDVLQEMNHMLNDRFVLPATDGGAANLWFFLEGRDEISQMITDDLREALVFTKVSTLRMPVQKDLEARVEAFLVGEEARNYAAFDLRDLDPATVTGMRKHEARAVLEEIGWLHRRYARSEPFDASEAERRLAAAIDGRPRYDDAEVLDMVREEFAAVVLSPNFDFAVDPVAARRVFEELLSSVAGGRAGEEDLAAVLIRTIPEARDDEDLASDAAFGLALRVEESLQNAFSETAFSALRDLFAPAARDNPDFEKKVRGLLLDVADDLAVFPAAWAGDMKETGRPVVFSRVAQSGLTAAFSRLDRFLFSSQIQSLLLALGMTFLLMIALRRSLLLGTLSILPILFTLGVIYGFLGFSGIPLDYSTMMIAGVSIGVGIDYTIHFVHGVLSATERGDDLEGAVRKTIIEKGRAILVNSSAVVLGFAVLQLSSMSPLRHFGGLMAGSMVLAALAALSILPASILVCRPKKTQGGSS